MRISELADTTGVSVATIKFYIREGMLPRGEATSVTSADYGDGHVARLKLIGALIESSQLSLANVKRILDIVDEPGPVVHASIGDAISALPPYSPEREDYPHARETLEKAGFVYSPEYVAVAQLENTIRGVLAAGLPWGDEQIAIYSGICRQLALVEIAPMRQLPPDKLVPFAVLGTALYEPVLLAMRRLAHQTVSLQLAQPDADDTERAALPPTSVIGMGAVGFPGVIPGGVGDLDDDEPGGFPRQQPPTSPTSAIAGARRRVPEAPGD